MTRTIGKIKLTRSKSLDADLNLVPKGDPNQDLSRSGTPSVWAGSSGSSPSLPVMYQAMSFNAQDIKNRLTYLYSDKDTPIKSLSGEAKAHYEYIVNHVTLLYNTDEYPAFYNLVKEVFNDTQFKIGTVSAYFNGCAIKTNIDPRGCSVICAGALPLPQSMPSTVYGTSVATGADGSNIDLSTCQYPVMLAVWDSGKYTITSLHNLENKDHTIIFIIDSSNAFYGFTGSEKQILTSEGVVNVSVYKTSEDGQTYTQMTPGFVPLDQVQSRELSAMGTNPNATAIAIGVTIAVIVVVIIALIIWQLMYYRQ